MAIYDYAAEQVIDELQQFYPISELGGFILDVEALKFSQDGILLASLANDYSLWVWDVETYEEVYSILSGNPQPDYIANPLANFTLAFSQGGQLLAFTCSETAVCFADAQSGDLLATINGNPSDMAFADDVAIVALRHDDGSLSLWGIED